MDKDYNRWNNLKKRIDRDRPKSTLIKEQEIWWCNVGLNIGDEENGKNQYFERPVLILKKFNNKVCLVIPLTSKSGNSIFYKKVNYQNKTNFVITSQLRLISTKRLRRLIGKIDYIQFIKIRLHIVKFFI